jgi:hypothetical protein
MALNFDKMRKDKAEKDSQRGGNWLNLVLGDNRVYIGGACRPEDEINYLEVVVHYGVGTKNTMALCLDDKNAIIHDPRVKAALKSRPTPLVIDRHTDCPVCAEWNKLKDGDADDKKQADSIRRNTRYLFNGIPFGTKKDTGAEWEMPEEQKVSCLMVGIQVWEGVLGLFFEEGDVTDVDKAVLFKINKSGSCMKTKYKVGADTETLRKPMTLSKALKRALSDAMEVGKEGDLYKVVADMAKSPAELEALLTGTEMADEDEGKEAAKPACFGLDYINDAECGACAFRGPCTEKLGKKLHPGHELKEGDLGYVAPVKKAATVKPPVKAKVVEPEPEEEPEEEEEEEEPEVEEEEEPEEEPVPKTKAQLREEAAAAEAAAAAKAKAKAKPASSGDDDLAALERELANKAKGRK